jgi:hypothetical protein
LTTSAAEALAPVLVASIVKLKNPGAVDLRFCEPAILLLKADDEEEEKTGVPTSLRPANTEEEEEEKLLTKQQESLEE